MKSEFIVGQNDSGTAKTVVAEVFGRKLHLLRAKNRENQDGVILPEALIDGGHWYEIIAVGSGCRYFTPQHVGGFVWLPDKAFGFCQYVGPAERVVDEAWFDQRECAPPLCVVFTEDGSKK